MKTYVFWLFILVFFWSCSRTQEQKNTIINLSENWTFKSTEDSIWLNAKVPGLVHLDLLENNIIEDPFYGNNEKKLQWIGKQDWEYKLVFNADTLLKHQNIDITFNGLDTYADIFLNGNLVLQANNMYRTWKIPIKQKLQKGENILHIVFYAPEEINHKKAQTLNYQLPDERGFSRKAPYHFGWDWGAKFLTAGIWKSVYLDCWNDAKISDIQIIQNKINTEKAEIIAKLNIESNEKGNYKIKLLNNENQLVEKEIVLKKGKNKYSIYFEISKPKLWWCNGMGKANLYNLKFELITENKTIDSKTETIGLRTIELIQEADSIGKSFYFKLNGKPIFAKGANWVPADNFLPRVKKQDYKELINSAVWANFNMLRVWGGGIYESDNFYNLCDENGILVWQDFMFACNMYPGDTSFVNNVKQEAIDNITRLRNHPSLAVWCGNNEIDNAWNDWGWQKQMGYSVSDSTEIWKNYKKVFHKLLPELVQEYDSARFYWPSSPQYGWGHKENFTQGDSHYWGVWWGHESFEVFNTKVGRFMSEYGFQALPNIKTIDEFASKKEQFIGSETMQTHQKHPTGYETINEYLQQYYKSTDNFEDYIYLSQLTQANGISTAIESHRRAKPYCMGTLYWQFNDAWPVTSWSSIDYYGRKKALHYFVKQAYKPIIISAIEENDSINIYVISDKQETEELNLQIYLKNFLGNNLFKETKNIKINNKSIIAYKIAKNKILNPQETFFYIELSDKEKIIDNDFYYFTKPKYLQLTKANIKISVKNNEDYSIITLQTDVLAKNVELISNLDGEFSDNYFDLLPNESKEIKFVSKEKGELIITSRCLNNL